MESIFIEQKSGSENAWVFDVHVGEGNDKTSHVVTVTKAYWKKLTGSAYEPRGLVRKSFEFLLARESKESILKEFELPLIQKYFPEYEEKIQKNIQ